MDLKAELEKFHPTREQQARALEVARRLSGFDTRELLTQLHVFIMNFMTDETIKLSEGERATLLKKILLEGVCVLDSVGLAPDHTQEQFDKRCEALSNALRACYHVIVIMIREKQNGEETKT